MVVKLSLGASVVLVDEEDLPVLLASRWHVSRHTTPSGRVYAYVATKKRRQLLHRVLMGARKGQVVDHIDGNGLNNTRANLRICTHAENMRNRRPTAGRELPKGVQRSGAGFAAQIRAGAVRRYERGFATPEDAVRRYGEWATELHGQFGRTR